MDGDKLIYIVGLGPGNTDYILKRATDILKKQIIFWDLKEHLNHLILYMEKKYI